MKKNDGKHGDWLTPNDMGPSSATIIARTHQVDIDLKKLLGKLSAPLQPQNIPTFFEIEDKHVNDKKLQYHPLFAGASVTKLIATMLIITISTVHGLNNKFVDELLYLLHKYILSRSNLLPSNMYHAKLLVEKIGHSYESIHACKNGRMLFRGVIHKDMIECPICNANRYKAYGKSQVLVNILRHFPLIS